MKHPNHKQVILPLLLFLAFQLNCGSGGGGEEQAKPLGLFEGPTANLSETPLPQDRSVQNTLVFFNGPGNEVSLFLQMDPVSETGKSAALSTAKDVSFINTPDCVVTDSATQECTQNWRGPEGGHLVTKVNIHFNNVTKSDADGVITLSLAFDSYKYENRCNQLVSVSGSFQCTINLELHATKVEGQALVELRGNCHTNIASNTNKTLALSYSEKEHRVGLDLTVQLSKVVDPGQKQLFFLRDMEIGGIVSVNGIHYAYTDIKNVDVNLCQ